METSKVSHRGAWAFVILLVAFLALAAAWRWTPLGDWMAPDRLSAWAQTIRTHPFAPLWVIGAYVVGGLVLIPVTLLMVLTAITFHPLPAIIYSFVGGVLSAVLSYWIGNHLGGKTARRLTDSRLGRVSRRLGKRGIITMVAARLLPLAPFTVVNMVAGASHIAFWDFFLGTSIGLLLEILAITLFGARLRNAIREPGVLNVLLTLAVLVLIVVAVRWLRRRLAPEVMVETEEK